MFWIIIIALVIVVGYFMSKSHSEANEKAPVSSTPVATWKKPVTPEEHLQFFAIMCELMSSYDDLPMLTVSWSWGPNCPDTVCFRFLGIDTTKIYNNTEAYIYLKSLSSDGRTSEYCYEYPLQSTGVPYYFRGDSALDFVKNYAPHAYKDDLYSASGFESITLRFEKHDLPWALHQMIEPN